MNSEQIIKNVTIGLIGMGILSLMISLVYFPDPTIVIGLSLGFILVTTNFVFITKIVAKILDQNYQSKLKIAVLFLLKLLFIAVVLWLAFGALKVNLIAFSIGYLCLVPVVVVVQIMTTGESKKHGV
jgi:hypothetical protein